MTKEKTDIDLQASDASEDAASLANDYVTTKQRLATAPVAAVGHILGRMSPNGCRISLQAISDHMNSQTKKLADADLPAFRQILGEQIGLSKLLTEYASAAVTSATTEYQAEAFSRIAISHQQSVRQAMKMLKSIAPGGGGDPKVVAELLL